MLIGLVAPHTTWKSTISWAKATLDSGVDAIWCMDERDPVLFLSALAQMVPRLRLGLFLSSLADRPAFLAARQLITLDHLSDGRLEIVVDDVAFYNAICVAFRDQLPTSSRLLRAPVWSIGDMNVGEQALIVEEISLRDNSEFERWENSCVIARSLTA